MNSPPQPASSSSPRLPSGSAGAGAASGSEAAAAVGGATRRSRNQLAASAAFIRKQEDREALHQAEMLRKQLAEKEDEIQSLRSLTKKGRLQKKLQIAMAENLELRQQLDEFYAKQEREAEMQQAQEDSLREIQRLKDEMYKLRLENDRANDKLTMENIELKNRNQQLEDELDARKQSDARVEEDIKELNARLQSKDAVIDKLKLKIRSISDGSHVQDLSKQVVYLRKQLADREQENEHLTAELSKRVKAASEMSRTVDDYERRAEAKSQGQVLKLQQRIKELEGQLAKSQDEAEMHKRRHEQLQASMVSNDARFVEMQQQIARYEEEFGIQDAMKQIRSMKAMFKKQEAENIELKDTVNKRERQMQVLVSENQILKERAGVPADWGLDPDELELRQQLEIQKARAETLHQQQVVAHLEQERLELMDRLRQGALRRTENGLIYLGLDAEQTKLVERYVEKLKMGDESLPLDNRSHQLQARVEQLETELAQWQDKASLALVDKEEWQRKYAELNERSKKHQYDTIIETLADLKQTVGRKGDSDDDDDDDSDADDASGTGRFGRSRRKALTRARSKGKGATMYGAAPDDLQAQVADVVDHVDSLDPKARAAVLTNLALQYNLGGIGKQQRRGDGDREGIDDDDDDDGSSFISGSSGNKRWWGTDRYRVKHQKSLSSIAEVAGASVGGDAAEDDDDDSASLMLSMRRSHRPSAKPNTMLKQGKDVDVRSFADFSPFPSKSSFARAPRGTEPSATAAAGGESKHIDTHALVPASGPEERTNVVQRRLAELLRGTDKDPKLAEARLVGLMKDLFHTEGALRTANAAIVQYRDQYCQLAAAQQLVYQEYGRSKRDWDAKFRSLTRELEQARDEVELKSGELSRLRELNERAAALAKMDPGQREVELNAQIDSLSRDLTIAQVQQKVLSRRHNALEEEMRLVTEREEAVTRDMINMEQVLQSRLSEMQKIKDVSEARVREMVEVVSDWVPRQELSKLVLDHEVLARQYSQLVSEAANAAMYRTELANLRAEKEDLELEAAQLRDQVSAMRAERGDADDKKTSDPAVLLAVAEKRAKRLEAAQQHSKDQLREAENELARLTKDMHDMRQAMLDKEAAVSDMAVAMEGSVSFRVADDMSRQLSSLRSQVAAKQAELDERQRSVETLTKQAKQMMSLYEAVRQENGELRRAIREMQESSDEATIIGKIKHALIQARVRQKEAERANEMMNQRIAQQETQLMQLQRRLEDRNADFFRANRDYRLKLASRDQTIASLRQRTVTGLSMKQAEALYQANSRLTAKLQSERERARAAQQQMEALELARDEVAVQLRTRQELLDSMDLEDEEDVRHQLALWSKRVEESRLLQMRLEHQARVLSSTVQFLERSNADHEQTISQLQQEVSDKQGVIDRKEMEWKERQEALRRKEIAIETKARMRAKAFALKQHTGDDSKHSGDDGDGGDADSQRMVNVLASEVVDKNGKSWRELVADLRAELGVREDMLSRKEANIEELRSKMLEQQRTFDKEIQHRNNEQSLKEAERQRILTTAQQTIESLQLLVKQKTDAVGKYEQIIERERTRFRAQRDLDVAEIERLNDQLMGGDDQTISKLNEALTFLEDMPNVPKGVVSAEQLEEIKHERDMRIASLQAEVDTLHEKLAVLNGEHKAALEQVQQYREELEAFRSDGGPTNRMRQLLQQLKRDSAAKEAKVRQLEQAVQRVKQELLEVTEAKADEMESSRTLTSAASGAGAGASGDATSVQLLEARNKLESERARWSRRQKALQAKLKSVSDELKQAKLDQQADERRFQDETKAHLKLIASLKSEIREKDRVARERHDEYVKKMRKLSSRPSSKAADAAAEEEQQQPSKDSGGDGGDAAAKDNSGESKAEDKDDKNKDDKSNDEEQAKRVRDLEAMVAKLRREREEQERKATEDELNKMLDTSSTTAAAASSNDEEERKQREEKVRKLSSRVDALKKKLADKDKTIKSQEKEIALLKQSVASHVAAKTDLLARLHSMESKMRRDKSKSSESGRRGRQPQQGTPEQSKENASPQSRTKLLAELGVSVDDLVQIDDLRQQLFEAQELIDGLNKAMEVRQETKLRVLQLDNERLKKKAAAAAAASLSSDERDSARQAPDVAEMLGALEQKDATIETLEDQLLEAGCDNLELKFEVEHNDVVRERLRTRIKQLKALNETLRAERQESEREEAKVQSEFRQESRTKSALAKAKGRAAELEGAVEAMRKMIEKLRADNDALRKTSHSNVKYMELLKENKRLKREAAQMRETIKAAEDRPIEKVQAELQRVTDLSTALRRQVKREGDMNQRLRKKNASLQKRLEEASGRLADAERSVESARKAGETDLFRATKVLKAEIKERERAADKLRAEMTRKDELLAQMADDMRLLGERVEQLTKEQQERPQRDLDSSRRTDPEDDRSTVSASASASAVSTSSASSAHQALVSAGPQLKQLHATVQRLQRENSSLKTALNKVKKENSALKLELSAFDESFFDEIEDLKYRFAEARKQLKVARATIQKLKQ